jgi:hypothetical protein
MVWSLGVLEGVNSILINSSYQSSNDLHIQDWPKVTSIYCIQNPYHLGEDIDVVGIKNHHVRKIKAYNMEECQRMVTLILLSASILNYHFLYVLCSHIEKKALKLFLKLCHHSLKKFLSYGRLHILHFYITAIYML